jgi:hypothetical protein
VSTKKNTIWVVVAGVVLLAVLGFLYYRHLRQPLTITGAIVVQDADFRKQLPIAGVEVRLLSGLTKGPVKSDPSGFFSLRLFKKVRRGQPITLQFRHPNYQPLDLNEIAGDKLYIVHMVPLARNTPNTPARPAIVIANVRARYSTKTQSSVNVGSAVKTFEVENVGNVPCGRHPLCSPDGKWKAAEGSVALDAGPGNEFHNTRLSCIAGPCPFTAVDSDEFSRGGQKISASVRDWSDTTTFLLEAEVSHTMAGQIDYQSYPVIFGTALSFTLPAQAETISLEADVSGETIIFPLGPDLLLSWANCNSAIRKDQTKVYRCELKPGYRFQ